MLLDNILAKLARLIDDWRRPSGKWCQSRWATGPSPPTIRTARLGPLESSPSFPCAFAGPRHWSGPILRPLEYQFFRNGDLLLAGTWSRSGTWSLVCVGTSGDQHSRINLDIATACVDCEKHYFYISKLCPLVDNYKFHFTYFVIKFLIKSSIGNDIGKHPRSVTGSRSFIALASFLE